MHYIFVLYDSITNSIFDGQIAQPLLERKKNNRTLQMVIISYEKNLDDPALKKIVAHYPTINFIFLQKKFFITHLVLFSEIRTLHEKLKSYVSYSLVARGPIAGYLCMYAAQKTNCSELIIQARGLLAEEYRFAHRNESNILFKLLQKWRARRYEKIEKIVYGNHKKLSFPVTVESVSCALQEFLVTSYAADATSFTLAKNDVPALISPEIVLQWRAATRHKLQLSEQNYVYCYNGSLKPWQCPRETVHYFKKQLETNTKIFLLILTHDKEEFTHLLHQEALDAKYYHVLTVAHNEIYSYLAACDAGIIFREKNAINWVSRPTKVLEYQAVGLPIIHNNTIAMLQNK